MSTPVFTRRSFAAISSSLVFAQAEERPNILWITCEDMGPHLGAYGDEYAGTPNLDALARRGMMYQNVWSNAPVCAPARTAIISGLYPTGTGSEHMRSNTILPSGMRMFPCYLRDAGYYTSNNSKEDYNLAHTGKVWDESSTRAHWRKRAPGQPFFSIFNFTITHESQIRTRPHEWIHDPTRVRLPAYHPDTPEVRQDWAQYYDNISAMDRQAGQILQQLEADGLAESTIVFFFSDHGPGMPRNKRWPYDCGLHVPLIVYFPERWRHLAPVDYRTGGKSSRLVSFVDLGPTVLSLAGLRPPSYMQGAPFAGRYAGPAPRYLYGFRGRMDERYDMVRSVRDHRFVYVRNYLPHRIYGQYLDYMFQTPTTRVWRRLYEEGRLNAAQRAFWEPKPVEELYDLQADRDEVRNLAGQPEFQPKLKELRAALEEHVHRVRDLGFLHEAEMHRRAGRDAPYTMGHDEGRYPFHEIWQAAEQATSSSPRVERLKELLQHRDRAVQYWACHGVLGRGRQAATELLSELRQAREAECPIVRILASEALARFGEPSDLKPSLKVLVQLANLEATNMYVSVQALNSLDAVGNQANLVVEELRRLPVKHPSIPPRMGDYVGRLVEYIAGKFGSGAERERTASANR